MLFDIILVWLGKPRDAIFVLMLLMLHSAGAECNLKLAGWSKELYFVVNLNGGSVLSFLSQKCVLC